MLSKYFKGNSSLEQANLRNPEKEIAKLLTKPCNCSLNWLAPAALQGVFFGNSMSLPESENAL